MASGTARTRRRPARRTSGAESLTEWVKRISPAGWLALGAGVIALALSLQTLQGQSGDYDEGVYWQSLRAMANGHPLFGSVFSSQPPLFLLSVYPFYIIFGQSLGAARLALVCFSLAGIAGVYVAGRAFRHRTVGAVAALLLALDPLYEHSAHTLQAELPSIALQIWAVALAALAMRASPGRRRRWLVIGAGALLGCALMVKLFAIVALVPVALYLSAPLAQHWLHPDDRLRQPPREEIEQGLRQIAPELGLLAAGLAGAVVLILLPFVGQLGVVYDQVVRFHLAAAATNSHPLSVNLRIIVQALLAAPLVYAALLAVAVIVWRRLWVSAPLLVWALAALILLARQQPLLAHHVVLLSPALALIAGCGAWAAWEAFAAPASQLPRLAATLALVVACCVGLISNWQNNMLANAPMPTRSLEMAIALQGVSAPDETVLSDDQYIAALANRDTPPEYVDTSAVRITSGYLTATQLEDYITRHRIHVILFATGRFDLLPGFRDWVAARYTRAATFDHGGALYLLEPGTNPPV